MSKSILSVTVAVAVLAVSLFAALPGLSFSADAATVEDIWDGTKVKPTKTDADGNILIETAEELAWVALEGSTNETKNKTFKVVDGAVFNLNGMKDVTLDSTAGEISVAEPTGYKWESSAKSFAGNFDGNGVVIYNMYAPGSAVGAYGGLFPWLYIEGSDKTCEFSNMTIKASYVKGYHFAAVLVGYADSSGAGRFVNITGVKVENCYVNATDASAACNRTGALVVGHAGHSKVTVDSCIAIDNIINATDVKGGFVGNTSAFANDAIIKNSILIGSTPYPALQSGSSKVIQEKIKAASCYSNVYTDQEVASDYVGYVTKVNTADMMGSDAKVAMSNLDWSKIIAFDGEYPDLRVNHNLSMVSNGASGHAISCSDCGKSIVETHNMVEDVVALLNKCACGYETPITEINDTWDGTQAKSFQSGTGTKEDPYIIANAEQLAYAALSTSLNSKGKYFKVVDNATFNMNGARDITPDSTAEEVKAAAKNGAYKWSSDSAKFSGNFDGNGVVIYNIYAPFSGYAGLFPNMNTDNAEKSVTIKNVAVKASSFAAYHAAGGIVGNATAASSTQVLNFENCMVANCYITDNSDANPACSRTVGTIAGRVAHNKTIVENCLAKGNLLEAINIVGGFVGNTSHYAPNAEIKNSISLGTLPYPTQNANSTSDLEDMVKNASCYNKVYTDMEVSGAYKANQVDSLTTAQMTGANCLDNMTLDFETIWFANENTPELQMFHNLTGTADADDAYAGHVAYCEDCGINGALVTSHIYDANFKCTICEFVCDHENSKYKIVTEDETGDCVTAPNTKTECRCGYIDIEYHGDAAGHKLVKVDAAEPTCIKNGNIEYWNCETCGKIFLTDDKMAAIDTAVSQEEISIAATQKHIPIEDSNGSPIYGMNAQKHWMICKYCGCEIDKVSHDVVNDTEIASGHSGKCVICLYEVHDYVDLNEKGKPVQAYDDAGHWYNCEDCGKAEYAEHTLETLETDEGVYKWCEDAEGNSCGYETFDYALTSEDGQVTVKATTNAFTKDVITDIFAISAEETLNYEEIKAAFEKAGHKTFKAYDFSPNEEIAEGGSVDLRMVAGNLYGKNAAIFYLDLENGTVEKVKTTVDIVEEGKITTIYANATITETGIYAVASGDVSDDVNDDVDYNGNINGDTSSTSPATKTQNVASATIVALLSAATIVFARKIKNS